MLICVRPQMAALATSKQRGPGRYTQRVVTSNLSSWLPPTLTLSQCGEGLQCVRPWGTQGEGLFERPLTYMAEGLLEYLLKNGLHHESRYAISL